MKNLSKKSIALLLLSMLVCSGCGGKSDGRLSASGTVTLDGSPLDSGSVVFADESGGSAGVGIIKGGSFTIQEAASSAGIQPGTYNVVVNSWEKEPGSVDDQGNIVAEGVSRIPEKYNDPKTSGLTATVSPDSQEFSFDLKSK